MTKCNLALSAVRNEKSEPHVLTVHGSVLVYTEETIVTFEKAVPQGFTKTVLLMNLTVTEKDGPMKETARPIHFEKCGDEVDTYKKVQVVTNDGQTCTVDVTVVS